MFRLIMVMALNLGLSVFSQAKALNKEVEFSKANELYLKGQFDKARPVYVELLKRDSNWGEVHYNLGNTYYKLGEFGKAIFHLRTAQEMIPRNGDIEFNLRFLRDKSKDKVEVSAFSKIKSFIPLNWRESVFLFFFFWALFFIFQSVLVFKNSSILKTARNLNFILVLLALIPLGGNYFSSDRFGVVVKPKIGVYSGPGRDNVKLFSLHEGTEFTIENEITQGKWIAINLDGKKKGWVLKDQVIF